MRADTALAEGGISLAGIAAEIGIATKRLAKMPSVPKDRDQIPEAQVLDFHPLTHHA